MTVEASPVVVGKLHYEDYVEVILSGEEQDDKIYEFMPRYATKTKVYPLSRTL